MTLPNKVYYVSKTPGGKALNYGWRSRRGSGLFTKAMSALGRHADLGRADIDSKLYVGDVVWREVKPVK